MSKDKDFIYNIRDTFKKHCGGVLHHDSKRCLPPEVQSGDSILDVDEWDDRFYLPLLFKTSSIGWETEGKKGVRCLKEVNLDLDDFLDFNLLPFIKSRMKYWVKDLIKEAMKEAIKEVKK
jgi:hypothetical protein